MLLHLSPDTTERGSVQYSLALNGEVKLPAILAPNYFVNHGIGLRTKRWKMPDINPSFSHPTYAAHCMHEYISILGF